MSPDDDDDRDARKRVAPASSSPPSSSSPGGAPGGAPGGTDRTRRPITIQIPPKRQHSETLGRLPIRDSRTPPTVNVVITAEPAAPAVPPAADDPLDDDVDLLSTTLRIDRGGAARLGKAGAGDDVDDAASTLRHLETADTGDLDIATEDTAPQNPALIAAAGAALGSDASLSMPLVPTPAGAPLAALAPRDAGEGPFFAPLPADRRAAVLARFFRRQLAPGMLVIRQGETTHPLYLVAHGLLEVRAERADGQLIPLDHIRAGDVVGEIGLLTQTPSPFQVIAATAVDVLALGPKDFYDIVGAFPALWAFLKELSERRTREYESRMRR